MFFLIFFTYITRSKDSLAKYYHSNKEKLKKKLVKDIKVFLKKKKKKRNNMVVKTTNIYEKIKIKVKAC